MPTVTDQMHRQVALPEAPQRIISLVPSQTELLFDLGLGDRVVGITKFCIHPEEWFRAKPRVGGTKKVDIEQVRALRPDLIIGNKEENAQADIEALEREFPVWMSDVNDLNGAISMIRAFGELTQTARTAERIVQDIEAAFHALQPLATPLAAAYFIWKDPWMLAGRSTFIGDMLRRCGFFLAHMVDERYPVMTENRLRELNPSIALLSSEPFPFREKHISAVGQLLPGATVHLVDGEMFSWYGSRLRYAPAYFKEIIALTSA